MDRRLRRRGRVDPPSFKPDLGGVNVIAPGTYFGVWQRLSTRNFGVIDSVDAF
jgi:hypothetical protein